MRPGFGALSPLAATLKWPSVLLFTLTVTSSALSSRVLTGAVYWDHSGPSGQGVGQVALSTRNGPIIIHYQKGEVITKFAEGVCGELGAIWTVQTKRSPRGADELVSVTCDGGLDSTVHSAWLAVREFLRVAAESAGYKVGYDPNRRGPIRLRLGQVENDISGYLDFGSSSMCLEMKKQINQRTVLIHGSGECFFWPALDFTVERDASSVWRVTSVTEVTEPSFDCTKAKTPTEVLICGSDSLAALDKAMALAYFGALGRLSNEGADRLRREQLAWHGQYVRECDAATSDVLRKTCVTHHLTVRTQQMNALQN